MNLYRVIIREPGAVTELETVRAPSKEAAMIKVRNQLIIEGRTLNRVVFEAKKLPE